MSSQSTPDLNSTKLWKRLNNEERLDAARAFWEDPDAEYFHRQAVDLLARQMKFRHASIAARPFEQKARYLASISGLTEGLAGRALISFHLARRRPMMGAFLDALGIAHDNGLITDDPVNVPDHAKVAAAAASLASTHGSREVALYLGTLLTQDPETWSILADLPELTPSA
jgi:hypothetical protein